MTITKAFRILSFLTFFVSYVWGIIFLIYSGRPDGLIGISVLCGLSLILFLFSHSAKKQVGRYRKNNF